MINELAIYFPNLEAFEDMDEALRYIDFNKLPSYLLTPIFTYNSSLTEYVANPNGLPWIDSLQKRNLDFSRLYFGQEFCQNLIPSANETEQAYYNTRQMEWEFTLVTCGYMTDKSLAKTRKVLDRLQEVASSNIEVVFNDWGLFNVLKQDYPGFTPVLGRILNKQTRLSMFQLDLNALPVLRNGIQTPIEDIRKKQLEAYADTSLGNEEFRDFLAEFGIGTIEFDLTQQGVKTPPGGWKMKTDFYFPWTFIATGRNCPTAGTLDPFRAYQVSETPCPRPCRKYNCSPNIVPPDLPVLQRGPALFSFNPDLLEPYLKDEREMDRLIYEPYIPL